MEIADQVYKGGTTSKKAIRAESDHASHGKKRKGWESTSPTNPEKFRTGKFKTNQAGHKR